MTEIWKSVVGWEGIYEVSNFGQVRSISRLIARQDGSTQRFRQCILSPRKNSTGYLIVTLSDLSNGRRATVRVHRLVAEAFIPNPMSLPEVNHIDSDRANARVDNLEWVTPSQNRYHGYHFGSVSLPRRIGEKTSSAKLDAGKVLEIRLLASRGVSSRQLAKKYAVNKTTILRLLSGETWSHVTLPSAPASEGAE